MEIDILPWTVDVDFAGETREEFLDYLHKAGLKGIYITCTDPNGPAGGWPILRLRGPSKESIMVFLLEVHGIDESDIHLYIPTPVLGIQVEDGCPCCD